MESEIIHSCHLGPTLSPEQFIPEHFFFYLLKGTMSAYDREQAYHLNTGDCGLARKHHLARYLKRKVDNQFEKVAIVFDEPFLRSFQEKHPIPATGDPEADSSGSVVMLEKNEMIENFIQSLAPYYHGDSSLDETFADVKREELLLILLQLRPSLANVLFDFGTPEKTNLAEFMNKNFRFNISLERFAFLTGRSLSSFKRDFKKIFETTPNHWLIQKRLEEAHYLIQHEHRKPVEVYLEVGFENLSHFSYVFKKKYGVPPSNVARVSEPVAH